MGATWIGLAIATISAGLGALVSIRDVRRDEERFRETLAQPGARLLVTVKRDGGAVERHAIDPSDAADVRTLLDLLDEIDRGPATARPA